jgi:hypothetical protein
MARSRLAAASSAALFVASALTVVAIGATAPAAAYEFRHEVTDDFDCDGVRDH